MIEGSDQVQDGMVADLYGARAVLDAGVLDALTETNGAFLTLVAAHRSRDPVAAPFGLSAELAAQVAGLDADSRRRAAACPYTLFNLRFDEVAFWQGVVAHRARGGSGSVSEEATFARTAVFFAWHLVRSNPLQASLVLGMGRPVQAVWRSLPLSALDAAATAALPHLQARWADKAAFWSKLLGTTDGSAARADAARLLGLQLLAADGISPRSGPNHRA